ncbi:MAG: serine protease [Chitinophagaceae bacterium]
MKENNDIMILDAVERYIRGEMNPDERLHFENLRKTSSEIDQLVVEHTLFLQQINRFGEWQKFRSTLQGVHTDLAEQGKINGDRLKGKARVVYLWNRYKKVTAIAASIAGITAITLSTLLWSVTPKPATVADYIELSREIREQKDKTNRLQQDINTVKDDVNDVKKGKNIPVINYKTVATGFFIDPKGLMITNAHVVKDSRNIRVFNTKGEQFNAFVVQLDIPRDVAIIKIDDPKFKPYASLPYGIRKSASDIAEPIFTLGFPRDEIVYGEGYLSARTGYRNDTLSCQIAVPANPGNSGGPVFNHNGEVIGILSSKQTQADDVVFAIQSKYIYQAVEQVKKNPVYQHIRIASRSNLAGLSKQQQVQKIEDFVFMVKGD